MQNKYKKGGAIVAPNSVSTEKSIRTTLCLTRLEKGS